MSSVAAASSSPPLVFFSFFSDKGSDGTAFAATVGAAGTVALGIDSITTFDSDFTASSLAFAVPSFSMNSAAVLLFSLPTAFVLLMALRLGVLALFTTFAHAFGLDLGG